MGCVRAVIHKYIFALTFSVCAILFIFSASLCFGEPELDILNAGRALVKEKDYETALHLYSEIEKWLRRDPGLVIEWARVYTYANRHSEAIALFEEIRTKYPDRAPEFLKELAEQYKWDSQYDKAIEVYKEVLQYEPDNLNLQLKFAQTLAWGGYHQEAIDKYESVLAKEPVPPDETGLLDLARQYVEIKSYDKALETYSKISDWLKKDPSLAIEWACVYTYANRHSEAIALFEEIRTKYPDRAPEFLRELAEQYKWDGQYDKAIEVYKEALQYEPGNIKLRLGLAQVLAWKGRNEEAISEYEAVLTKDPKAVEEFLKESSDSETVLLDTARTFVSQKGYGIALEIYSQIDNLIKNDPSLMIEWARVYTYANRHSEAIALFEEIRTKYPDRAPEFLRELAEQYKWSGKHDKAKAIEVYKEALQYDPNNMSLQLGLAQTYAWSGHHREALDGYVSVLAKDPMSTEALQGLLDLARQYVEIKSYDKALGTYSKISDWLKKDPSLAIEWARAYTYANRHSEAIALFEEIRTKYPDRAPEFLRELAEQYKWDSQYDKAIEVYKEALRYDPTNMSLQLGLAQAYAWSGHQQEAIAGYNAALKIDPNSIEALLGKAEVLSWIDKLEQADNIYKKVLEIDPTNIHALNGRTRVMVWQGYYRRGIAGYKRILEIYPDNIDALEGLAFAYHWSGNQTKALDMLEKLFKLEPSRKLAGTLYYRIRNSIQPYITNSNRYSHDKNGLRIFSTAARSGMYPETETKAEGIYERLMYRNPNHNASSPITGTRGGVGYSRRISDSMKIDGYLYLTKFDAKDFTPFTANTWLTFTPHDMWTFYLSYNRETFEDIDAVINEIVMDSGSVTADFRPDRWWYFSANYKRGDLNDSNTQDSFLGKVEYRLNQDPYAKLYYNYYLSDWSERLNHGYFNPYEIQAHTLGLYSSIYLSKKLFLEGQSSVGYEFQNPPSSHATYFSALGLNYQLSENWLLSLKGECFDARPDDHSRKGYSKKSLFLTFNYRFGAEPEEVEEPKETAKPVDATQPSRPITGQ